MRILILAFFLVPQLPFLIAQDSVEPMNAEEKSEVVDSIGNILERIYIFPEIGKEIKTYLSQRLSEGAYDATDDPREFEQILTEDIRSINDDRHLRVGFDPERIKEMKTTVTEADSIAFQERRRREARLDNYGFKEVKILDGNIGYLNLTGFYGVTDEAGQTAEAAMNLLANADAMIIDLRQNGGGSPQMIQLITSYLFNNEPVHLNNFYHREEDDIEQTWTLPYVPGKRRPDVDVYVLTSGRTFSAAEEFSYNLRNLERATLVGEVTGGGAHPGGTRIATDRFTVWVPSGRAINPISNTNWEGTGVEPHFKVPADQAMLTAQKMALKSQLADCSEEQSYYLRWVIDGLDAKENKVVLQEETMRSYKGIYGPRSITFKDGSLYYQREGNPAYELIPISTDLFMIEEIPYFRIRMITEDGKTTGLLGLYQDGRQDKNVRTHSGS